MPVMSHERVIQPSAELVEEVKAAQAEQAAAQALQTESQSTSTVSTTAQPQQPLTPQTASGPQQAPVPPIPSITSENVAQPPAAIVAERQPPQSPSTPPVTPSVGVTSGQAQVTTASSIYPEPTHNALSPQPGAEVAAPSSAPSLVQSSAPSAKTPGKALAVKIVASILVIIDLSNAYNWYLAKQAGTNNWQNIIGIAIALIVTVGIFRLKEVARAAYVIVSVALLIIAGIGMVELYTSTHNNPSYQANANLPSKSNLELALTQTKKDTWMTPQQKREEIRTLQNQISAESGSKTEVDIKQYVAVTLTLVVSIGPLIFLTRPSIKEVFSA
jgi:hypothetical protein